MQLISGVAPKAALPQVSAGQADVTHLGSEQPLAVAVVVGGALSRAALMWSDADRHGILGLQQALSIPAQHLGEQGASGGALHGLTQLAGATMKEGPGLCWIWGSWPEQDQRPNHPSPQLRPDGSQPSAPARQAHMLPS